MLAAALLAVIAMGLWISAPVQGGDEKSVRSVVKP